MVLPASTASEIRLFQRGFINYGPERMHSMVAVKIMIGMHIMAFKFLIRNLELDINYIRE